MATIVTLWGGLQSVHAAKHDEDSKTLSAEFTNQHTTTNESVVLKEYSLIKAYPQLNSPTKMVTALRQVRGSDLMFYLSIDGELRAFKDHPEATEAELVLDLKDRIRPNNNFEAEGFFDMVLHPEFMDNGKIYISYCSDEPVHLVISEFQIQTDKLSESKADSEKAILKIDWKLGPRKDRYYREGEGSTVHHGGALAFGPDHYLYISVGDGGPQYDPFDHGQRLDTLKGKILRIDIDQRDPNLNYAIPKDNPFANRANARPEIWAFGFREPWRMAFDFRSDDLWVGECGFVGHEEINKIKKGGNYGWNRMEGFFKTPRYRNVKQSTAFIPPLIEFTRSQAFCLIGGYVYHGESLKELIGAYLYADLGTGRVGAVTESQGKINDKVLLNQKGIISFAQKNNGEILFLRDNGQFYKLSALEKRIPDPDIDVSLIFKQNCGLCHGDRGDGKGSFSRYMDPPPPSLLTPKVRDMSPDELFNIITQGSDQMPGFESRLSLEERQAIVGYVKKLGS